MVRNIGKIYLLINSEIGKERAVRDSLRKMENVKSADMITGRYDIIALIEGETIKDIFSTIMSRIRSIDGIIRTETNLVID
ncbi:MAG TPA: AsnC family transcriptional regulator [Nitrospiraceae bacterium]|nr:AsnC family transcriptional regulator [Nitrospiraceae bacterium]HBI24923.1 AsnC family transcriptional regulator [Nitrospiraceae bacterium]